MRSRQAPQSLMDPRRPWEEIPRPARTHDDQQGTCAEIPAATVEILPLAYGYLRVDLVSGEVADAERRLRQRANELGFELAAVFREASPQATVPAAYLDLVRECCRAEAHIVITVPGHLSGMGVPRLCLLDILAARADARVCEVVL